MTGFLATESDIIHQFPNALDPRDVNMLRNMLTVFSCSGGQSTWTPVCLAMYDKTRFVHVLTAWRRGIWIVLVGRNGEAFYELDEFEKRVGKV